MRRTLLAAVGCFMALASLAQNNAEIIVSYNFKYPGISGKERTQKMSLLASTAESKYFNDLSLWVDSLKSTPDGKAKYMDILKKACMTTEPDGSTVWNMSKGPYKSIYTYVFTNPAEGNLTL